MGRKVSRIAGVTVLIDGRPVLAGDTVGKNTRWVLSLRIVDNE